MKKTLVLLTLGLTGCGGEDRATVESQTQAKVYRTGYFTDPYGNCFVAAVVGVGSYGVNGVAAVPCANTPWGNK